MNNFLNTVKNSIASFANDEEGAGVVEYAMIIAVISLGLIFALKSLNGAAFTGFIARVNACLTGVTANCLAS